MSEDTLIEKLKSKAGEMVSTGQSPIGTVSAMLAAQAKAAVEARFIVALQRPRNWDDVRIKLLAECRRPAFAANKSAYYRKPIGKGIEGLGIRFAEVALRCMTNVLVETTILHDDERVRMLKISVTDLEANETIDRTITVVKTVERSRPADDGTYVARRKNSEGNWTYTLVARDEEILDKEGAMISKALRTLALRIVPGDLQDESEALILQIRQDTAAKDPAAERKRIADAFAEIGVMPSDISMYLGHDFGTCSPAELVTLRGVYGAIRDGETTWKATMDHALAGKSPSKTAAPADGPDTPVPPLEARMKARVDAAGGWGGGPKDGSFPGLSTGRTIRGQGGEVAISVVDGSAETVTAGGSGAGSGSAASTAFPMQSLCDQLDALGSHDSVKAWYRGNAAERAKLPSEVRAVLNRLVEERLEQLKSGGQAEQEAREICTGSAP